MERAQRKHGDVFRVQLGPLKRCVFIADPNFSWQVLTGKSDLVRMGSTNGIFRPVLGDRSLFLLDGEEHSHHRSLIAPAFHTRSIGRWEGLIAELGAREVATWPNDTVFPIQERMRNVTLEAIFRIVLGAVEEGRSEILRETIHDLLDLVQDPIAVLPWFQYNLGGRTPFAHLMKKVAEIDELLYAEIGARRYDLAGSDRDDVLSMLVRPQPHEPGFMSDREVRDEILTLLIAGHETTATALSWTFERIVRHPEAMAMLREDLEGGSENYLYACVREAMRQRPVLPVTARKLVQPIQYGEVVIPAGWTLMSCIYLLHHDTDFYEDPEVYRPERFISQSPNKRVWLPFGAGSRHCIGHSLATMAVKGLLGSVIRRVRLEPERQEPEQVVRRNFTLGPERGARVVVVERLEPGVRDDRPVPAG